MGLLCVPVARCRWLAGGNCSWHSPERALGTQLEEVTAPQPALGVPIVWDLISAEKVTGCHPSPGWCGAEKLPVPFRCAIVGCAGQLWDLAEGSLAAAGTKKLSKGCSSAAKELLGTARLPGAPPVEMACDICV